MSTLTTDNHRRPLARWADRLALGLFALMIAVPLAVVVTGSLKTQGEIFSNPFGVPSLRVSNFAKAWRSGVPRAFLNSVLVAVFSVTFTLFFASLASYAVIRLRGWRSGVLVSFFTLGMILPAQISVVQQYAFFKDLGLTDNPLGLIIVNIAVTLPVSVFILSGFMRSLPKELFEAATVDGANHWRVYRSIVMPLSLPSVAAVTTFLFVIHWNDLLYPLYFIQQNPEWDTLPRVLVRLRGEYVTNYPVLFAGVLIASAPVVLAYLFLQRWFISGMTSGAVKG